MMCLSGTLVRLLNPDSTSSRVSYGVVEIYNYPGCLVCNGWHALHAEDGSLHVPTATVICRQLGFEIGIPTGYFADAGEVYVG